MFKVLSQDLNGKFLVLDTSDNSLEYVDFNIIMVLRAKEYHIESELRYKNFPKLLGLYREPFFPQHPLDCTESFKNGADDILKLVGWNVLNLHGLSFKFLEWNVVFILAEKDSCIGLVWITKHMFKDLMYFGGIPHIFEGSDIDGLSIIYSKYIDGYCGIKLGHESSRSHTFVGVAEIDGKVKSKVINDVHSYS